jgi:cell division protein FtsQ
LREQVITPRAGRAASASKGRAGEIVQKPARRGRGGGNSGGTRTQTASHLRKALAYMPFVGKLMLAVIAGILIFAGYRAAASASFFKVQSVDVSGTSRVSAKQIEDVVLAATMQTGVWRADLVALSRELEHLPWVRRAIVSRVLPDGLRVRVTERQPRAVVRTASGKFIWVDDDAVTLGAMSPTDQMPNFFIRGWDESETDEARSENRERLKVYMEVLREWQELGIVERVSEVNLIDLRDVRVLLAGDDSQIEVRIGKENLGFRLKKAIEKLDKMRDTPGAPLIVYLDASRVTKTGDGLVVGYSRNVLSTANGGAESEAGDAVQTKVSAPATEKPSASRSKKETEEAKAKERDAQKKERAKEREKKSKTDAAEKSQTTRLRRVG